MLGQIDLSHSAFAEALEHVITLGEHASDERIDRSLRPQWCAVVGAEARSGIVFDTTLRTHFRDRDRFALRGSRLLREAPGAECAHAKRRIGSL